MNKAFALITAAALAGCAGIGDDGKQQASAQLQATRGSSVTGTATFEQSGGKVRVVAVVSGLAPGREHGFHIHEVGDCSSGDGMSAKGHFNPHMKPHGHYAGGERHAGDLPALRADQSGRARLEQDLDIITVRPGPASIIGRGLIVHADADDYKTQPTGNAGARLACAIIQRS